MAIDMYACTAVLYDQSWLVNSKAVNIEAKTVVACD